MRPTNEDFDLEGVEDSTLLKAKRLSADNTVRIALIWGDESRYRSLVPVESKIRELIDSLYVEYDAWQEYKEDPRQAKYCLEEITAWTMRLEGKCGRAWSDKSDISTFCSLLYGHDSEHENKIAHSSEEELERLQQLIVGPRGP